jgi:ribose transport system permease protein
MDPSKPKNDLIETKESDQLSSGSIWNRIWMVFVSWDLASAMIALVLIGGALLILQTKSFASAYNLSALGFNISITSIVALSQMSVIAVGQMNIALTAIGVMVAIFAGWLMQVVGLPALPAVSIAILFGVFAGWLQGIIITRTAINPFIVSLALASVYFGGLLGITRGASYNKLPSGFVQLGRQAIGGFPVLLIFSLIIAGAMWILLQRTVTGRKLLATGASSRVAGMSGISTGRIILFAHTLSGFLAAIAGIMTVARLGSAQPSIGTAWLLPSFAATVLGGSILTGGRVSVVGALFGALLLALIDNGLVLIGVNVFFYQAVQGLVLVAALAVDRGRKSYVAWHKI